MEMRFLLGVLFILSCGIMDTAGSTISLSSSPASLMPGLTQSLSLSCSINDTAASSSLVGRDLTASVNNTAGNLLMLTSLVMMRDNVDIAMVTTASPAHALADKGKAIVTGTASGSSGVRGHLDVVYQDPASDQAGSYSCEASGVDDHGHHVALTTSVDVVVSEPGISDLVHSIHDMRTNSAAKIDSQEAELVKLRAQLSSMNESMTHVETGFLLWNTNYGDWSKTYMYSKIGHSMYYQDKTVTFKKPYTSPPVVTWSTGSVEHTGSKLFYTTEVTAVTEAGFTIRVGCYSTDHDWWLYRLGLEWTSLAR